MEREVVELVARCVSSMVFYHNSKTSPLAKTAMASEICLLPALVSALGIEDAESEIIRPVENELLARYGPELGFRLFKEFAEVFDASSKGGLSRATMRTHR